MNWATKPLVRLLLPFAAGILACGIYDGVSISFLLLLTLVTFGICSWLASPKQNFQYRWLYGFFICVVFMSLGYILCWYSNTANHKNFFTNHLSEEKSELLIGVVSDLPKYGKWTKIKLDIQETARTDGRKIKSVGYIEALIQANSTKKQLNYGDLIAIPANKIQKIKPPKNPNSFNYKKYLRFQNIHYQCFIKQNEYILLDSDQIGFVYWTAYKLRMKFLAVLEKHLSKNDNLPVSSALILGYKHDLDKKIRSAYADTGSMHVLAVSGLHVGFIYAILIFLLDKIRSHKQSVNIIKLFIILFGLWSFVLITGASSSVARAALMLSIVAHGKYTNQMSFVYNTIAASAFLILMWDPYELFQVGFQLSFLAVLGIMFFYDKIRKWFLPKNMLLYKVWQGTAVGIAAQITVIPLSIFYFGRVPIYFWLTGFIVVFAAGLVLYLGVLLFLLEFTVPFLAVWVGKLLDLILTWLNKFIYLVQEIPYGVIGDLSIGTPMLVTIYIVLLSAIFWIRYKKDFWLQTTSILFFATACWFSFQQYKNYQTKEITVYDAGKGNTLIDFIYNQKVISLVNSNIDSSKIEFVASGNRNSLGINDVTTINIDTVEYFKNGVFIWQKPFIQFYDKKMMIVESNLGSEEKLTTKIDHLILRNNPKIKIEELSEVIDFQEVITDNTNNYWTTNKWRTECENQKITFTDSKNKAVILSLKN